TGHTSLVHDIAISPNGRILASASWDSTARLWNLENGQPIAFPAYRLGAVRVVFDRWKAIIHWVRRQQRIYMGYSYDFQRSWPRRASVESRCKLTISHLSLRTYL